ncbi:MAG: translation initiation factor IF-2 [Thermodesulfobacteriota bacterium]|nr:translation initiation factor IF-2 [Thermodesulfobacteriota bacterium]
MGKVKVLDLAREVGMEDDKLILKLKRMGLKVKDKNPAPAEKAVSPSDERIIERNAEKEVVEKRVKPTVIRRRTRSLEAPVTTPATPQMTSEPIAVGISIEVKPEVVTPREETRKEGKTPEKRALEEEKPARKPLEGKKPESTLEVKIEAKETVPAKQVEGIVPPRVTLKETAKGAEQEKRTKETKPMEIPGKKPEMKFQSKEAFPEGEKPFTGKKKGVVKKRRFIEERMFKEGGGEEDEKHGKEAGVEIRTFRPMKRKIVLKSLKKTEVTVPKPIKRIIRITEVISIGDLAKRMGVKGGDLIKKLMDIGVLANINQHIDADVASLVASEFGYEVERVSIERQDLLERREDRPEQLQPRPPVVTIMGHVDHGKTMLLDAIRKTKVVEGEAGGITQHIGAYDVQLENGHVVFIDTPGHEAFTAMRARGAQVTDVVVLVVAADDGVMPQTKEAIDHSRAAKVPILVAINKIDKPNANPEKVKKDLAEYDLLPEQWGGSTLYAEISAKQKTGIKELLELILLQAEILDLKANPDKPARGIIIEAKLDKGRGPIPTILVQEGTLKTGDVFIAGSHYGRVRAMLNDKGQKIEASGPSAPVEVLGFTDVPEAGETFIVVSEERMAKQISLYRQEKIRAKELSKLSKVSLEELYEKIKKGEIKELNVVMKADVQGSIEAMKEALGKLSNEAVKVNIIHDGVGGITETDVNLASASNAIIIGFNVRPGPKAQSLAEHERVDLRTYSVIYDAISDIRKAMEGLLEPTYKEHILGRAQVLELFNVRKVGTIAGSLIIDGKVVRGSHARLLRDNMVIYDGRITSLRRFKDDMKECAQGLECGILIETFNDIKPGDIIESYEMEEIQPRLS